MIVQVTPGCWEAEVPQKEGAEVWNFYCRATNFNLYHLPRPEHEEVLWLLTKYDGDNA